MGRGQPVNLSGACEGNGRTRSPQGKPCALIRDMILLAVDQPSGTGPSQLHLVGSFAVFGVAPFNRSRTLFPGPMALTGMYRGCLMLNPVVEPKGIRRLPYLDLMPCCNWLLVDTTQKTDSQYLSKA